VTGGFWGGNSINIKDCLTLFSQEEMLTGNDKWYCSKCKDHQNALKKMEIYRSPEYLIMHLKRFSHSRSSFFSSKKITDEIGFPVQGLDMEPFILQ
jgi:ubiquitin carboxyl-terminal hydrolase 4/11/15